MRRTTCTIVLILGSTLLAAGACSGGGGDGLFEGDDAGTDGSAGQGGGGGAGPTTCDNSLDCDLGRVCDRARGICVGCVRDGDCEDGDRCVADECRSTCDSDNDCLPLGLLCDFDEGVCVECTGHPDCRDDEYCGEGSCRPDDCEAGRAVCDGDAIVTCGPEGQPPGPATPCGSQQTCTDRDGTATCEDWVCSPGATECDGMELVVCSSDGTRIVSSTDCADSDRVCVDGECRDLLCAPSALFCEGDTVQRCAADGRSQRLVETCPVDEYCEDGACNPQVCTPDAPTCDGTVATRCNAQGSGVEPGGTDCATTGEICADGSCESLLCPPLDLRCNGGDVEQCAADGMSWEVLSDCSPTQYCDEAAFLCRAQVCTPDAPTCDGNVARTCNSQGSGFTSGGTDCGLQTCIAGACQQWTFLEDFEDGDFAGWTSHSTSYTRSVTTSTAADGTQRSFTQTAPGAASHYSGVHRDFTNQQPTHVSWWARTEETTGSTTYFVIHGPTSSPSGSTSIAFVYFRGDNDTIRLAYADTDPRNVETPYTVGQWHHIELRNIDWTAQTFDFYVDDALMRADNPFRNPATEVGRVDLYHFDGATGYWDEIGFR